MGYKKSPTDQTTLLRFHFEQNKISFASETVEKLQPLVILVDAIRAEQHITDSLATSMVPLNETQLQATNASLANSYDTTDRALAAVDQVWTEVKTTELTFMPVLFRTVDSVADAVQRARRATGRLVAQTNNGALDGSIGDSGNSTGVYRNVNNFLLHAIMKYIQVRVYKVDSMQV